MKGIKKYFLNLLDEIKIKKKDKKNNAIEVLSPLSKIVIKLIIEIKKIRKMKLYDFLGLIFQIKRKTNSGKNLAT